MKDWNFDKYLSFSVEWMVQCLQSVCLCSNALRVLIGCEVSWGSGSSCYLTVLINIQFPEFACCPGDVAVTTGGVSDSHVVICALTALMHDGCHRTHVTGWSRCEAHTCVWCERLWRQCPVEIPVGLCVSVCLCQTLSGVTLQNTAPLQNPSVLPT